MSTVRCASFYARLDPFSFFITFLPPERGEHRWRGRRQAAAVAAPRVAMQLEISETACRHHDLKRLEAGYLLHLEDAGPKQLDAEAGY